MKLVGCLVSLLQNQRGHALPVQDKLDEHSLYLGICYYFHQVFTKKHLSDINTTMMRLKGYCNAVTNYYTRKGC